MVSRDATGSSGTTGQPCSGPCQGSRGERMKRPKIALSTIVAHWAAQDVFTVNPLIPSCFGCLTEVS